MHVAGRASSERSDLGSRYDAENDFAGKVVFAFTAEETTGRRQDILSVNIYIVHEKAIPVIINRHKTHHNSITIIAKRS